jgi:hypothetical protein
MYLMEKTEAERQTGGKRERKTAKQKSNSFEVYLNPENSIQ